MNDKSKVLIIEDDPAIALSVKRLLESEGYLVDAESTAENGIARAQTTGFDVIITDLQLPGLTGLEIIDQLHREQPHVPVILMTAHHTTSTAIEAIKLGAYDYILKPCEINELLEMLERATASSRLVTQPVQLGEGSLGKEAIIGTGKAMQDVYKEIGRVAAKPVTVLIRGETGTGKELVARAIHQHSDRAMQPFIIVNCVAIPETLLESELFGHEKGAFTGADTQRVGRFEQANNGTIFLDEIGDMSMSTQAKLLRVLQEKTIRRLGGKEMVPVNVRVLAATHKKLEPAIREKQFREDLYYRLNVAVVALPPLRDRREDIPSLIKYFLRRYGPELGSTQPSISADAIKFLQHQQWQGNVRELENVVRKTIIAAHGYSITLKTVQEVISKKGPPLYAPSQTIAEYVNQLLSAAMREEAENIQSVLTQELERELYSQAIKLAQGNQARAAKWLGVSRPTIREKLTQYKLLPTRKKQTDIQPVDKN